MLLWIFSSFFRCFLFKMSGFQPFQFELTYFPGEEPTESEGESEREAESLSLSARVGNTEWWIINKFCGGNCVAITTADECFCCQELHALNPKFDEATIECITGYSKFRIVCLDIDVLDTALVAIHNARCNPLPDPIENRLVFWQFSG